jgi:hypothetical protein
MAAIETVAGYVNNPTSTQTALTMATGDSLTVRNFPAQNPAYLMAMLRGSVALGTIRVRSPLLHDNVNGIQVTLAAAENPALYAYPCPGVQTLKPQDNLIVEVTGGSAYDVGALTIYYTAGSPYAARLHQYGDFKGMIKSIVTVTTTCTIGSTPVAWVDTAISGTLLHANTDYAVLGMFTDLITSVIAIKGVDTNNMRIGMAGRTSMYDTSDYFVKLSERSGLPCIPVFNAANAASTYVSIIDTASSGSSIVTLVLAECGTNTGL